MLPTREEAFELVRDGLSCNPGPWGRHCLTAAHCAEKIANACGDMDSEKAYILGLLHDIGRKFGTRHLGHVSDGYTYMKSLGYDEVAKICLTHSFNNHTVDEYIGKFDSAKVMLKPAVVGTGIIAGGSVRPVLELAGYKNIRTKIIGTNNPRNVVYATLEALKSMQTVESVAAKRGKRVEDILG